MATDSPDKKTPVEQPNPAYWMGRVDSTLGSLIAKVEQITSENKEHWASMDKWRETVDQSVLFLTTRSQENAAKIATLEAKLKPEVAQVDFRWIVEKIGVPLILAFLTWFALTILPNLLKSHP